MPWANITWETLLPVLSEQGYMIVATGNEYIECAKCLAGSIKQHNTYNQVCLLTDVLIEDPLFDYVRIMQNPNANAFANDWQVFNTSPFRETIKLEADCLVTSNIDYLNSV